MATFKARARAVEMLGRQQIAGIPTAISELFKNAHDAYADVAEVDYLRYASLFILRDDGLGMSKQDFQDRWLVLGTESKLDLPGLASSVPSDPQKAKRSVLGEKGIGRLAIAAIGPQVLILTRPKYPDHADLTAAFIHWDLFAVPGVNLDELQIPIRSYRWGSVPDERDVHELVAESKAVLDGLGQRIERESKQRILSELEAYKVNPRQLMDYLGAPTLVDGHGTHFYIAPTDEAFESALFARSEEVASPLVKMLIGFSNTMTPTHTPPAMRTAFRSHEDDLGNFDDLIADSEFFTPDEFTHADHHLEGVFDDYGQFRGSVTVYGHPNENYVLPYNAGGNKTRCGPFRINVAVVQGAERESTLPTERWSELYAKLNKMGGLYIYRDGVRVLPYGNTDYDFIDIEKRRTLSAKYYYFSYRRIFGVIEIDSQNNRELVEKAGREGFRENVAYRQFRDILENFFVNIAATFFREGGERADYWSEKRSELDRVERARRKREKKSSERRALFEAEIEQKFERINAGEPQAAAAKIVNELSESLAILKVTADDDYAQRGFLRVQTEALADLTQLRDSYKAARPRGVGLPQRLRRDFDAYAVAYKSVQESVFEPTERQIESLLQNAARESLVAIDRRIRFHRAIELTVEGAKANLADAVKGLSSASQSFQVTISGLSRDARVTVDDACNNALADAAAVNVLALSDDEFVERRLSLESKVTEEAERQISLLNEVRDQVASLTWERDEAGDLVSGLDMVESVDDEILELRERLDADLELAQLGMAVKIINHEFESTIRSVRANLRKLRAWSDANAAIRPIYDGIHHSFEHLDGYLRMFTPLQRRLYRSEVLIKGSGISKFVGELFEDRLRDQGVALTETRSFKRAEILGYPSTYYPVFVNLVDNALYWVQQGSAPYIILFDARESCLIVANSGPAIGAADRDRIFVQGFSRRPGGRGLGLYISREVLRGVGGDLIVFDPPPKDFGAAFGVVLPLDAREPQQALK